MSTGPKIGSGFWRWMPRCGVLALALRGDFLDASDHGAQAVATGY
jgi:hypothetical protein